MVKEKLNPTNSKGYRIPVLTKLKARNLYLSSGLSHDAISLQTGLSHPQVAKLISREGWAKLKKSRESRLAKIAQEKQEVVDTEVVETIASEAQEIMLGGLDRAKGSLSATHEFAAKDFQSWTSGVKNLAGVITAIRGDDQGKTNVSESRGSINLFFIRPSVEQASAKAEPKRVSPASSSADVVLGSHAVADASLTAGSGQVIDLPQSTK